jgi:hypothetical protein
MSTQPHKPANNWELAEALFYGHTCEVPLSFSDEIPSILKYHGIQASIQHTSQSIIIKPVKYESH